MSVVDKIKVEYPFFNEQNYIGLCENIFEKIHCAWMDYNLNDLSIYETTELFLEHRNELEKLKISKIKDVVKDIVFEDTQIISFDQDQELDVIEIEMKLLLINYYLDESNQQVIKGNDVNKKKATYHLTFINQKGKLMEKKIINGNDVCPYCGAPINLNINTTCDYCHRTIYVDIDECVLKLSNLVLINVT